MGESELLTPAPDDGTRNEPIIVHAPPVLQATRAVTKKASPPDSSGQLCIARPHDPGAIDYPCQLKDIMGVIDLIE